MATGSAKTLSATVCTIAVPQQHLQTQSYGKKKSEICQIETVGRQNEQKKKNTK